MIGVIMHIEFVEPEQRLRKLHAKVCLDERIVRVAGNYRSRSVIATFRIPRSVKTATKSIHWHPVLATP